ncbi:hypothetical protein FAI40_08035 [Acetobacteraceae bacterium]|nr:hypothetical protein FAI40_08035 [Acetobacteraceae bacterium]
MKKELSGNKRKFLQAGEQVMAKELQVLEKIDAGITEMKRGVVFSQNYPSFLLNAWRSGKLGTMKDVVKLQELYEKEGKVVEEWVSSQEYITPERLKLFEEFLEDKNAQGGIKEAVFKEVDAIEEDYWNFPEQKLLIEKINSIFPKKCRSDAENIGQLFLAVKRIEAKRIKEESLGWFLELQEKILLLKVISH